jgi:hypothetical protein
MARIKANLMDENDRDILSIEIESEVDYHPNDWFKTPDGATYVIADVRPGDPPIDVELDACWLDGPHPTTLVGRHG